VGSALDTGGPAGSLVWITAALDSSFGTRSVAGRLRYSPWWLVGGHLRYWRTTPYMLCPSVGSSGHLRTTSGLTSGLAGGTRASGPHPAKQTPIQVPLAGDWLCEPLGGRHQEGLRGHSYEVLTVQQAAARQQQSIQHDQLHRQPGQAIHHQLMSPTRKTSCLAPGSVPCWLEDAQRALRTLYRHPAPR
jgi:hypothetical protein